MLPPLLYYHRQWQEEVRVPAGQHRVLQSFTVLHERLSERPLWDNCRGPYACDPLSTGRDCLYESLAVLHWDL